MSFSLASGGNSPEDGCPGLVESFVLGESEGGFVWITLVTDVPLKGKQSIMSCFKKKPLQQWLYNFDIDTLYFLE